MRLQLIGQRRSGVLGTGQRAQCPEQSHVEEDDDDDTGAGRAVEPAVSSHEPGTLEGGPLPSIGWHGLHLEGCGPTTGRATSRS